MDVCNSISAIILEVVDPVYLATLRLPYVGIGTCTPLQLLAHLYTNYAKITPAARRQRSGHVYYASFYEYKLFEIIVCLV
jgi:hypothetical protein